MRYPLRQRTVHKLRKPFFPPFCGYFGILSISQLIGYSKQICYLFGVSALSFGQAMHLFSKQTNEVENLVHWGIPPLDKRDDSTYNGTETTAHSINTPILRRRTKT